MFRLPLRAAVELLSNRVEQLCLFIHESGLEAPPMPQEKHTALAKVLDLLGLTEVHSAAENNHTKNKSPNPDSPSAIDGPPSDAPISVPFSAAGIANDLNSTWAQASKSPDPTSQNFLSGSAMLSDTHPVSTLPMTLDTGDLDISIAEQYQPVDGHSDHSLANWDWTLDFGTCITPPSPDIPDIDIEPLQSPGEQFERRPEPFAAVQTPPNLNNDTRSAEGIEDLIDELSDRMGTLRFGPGGRAHFYGPTSTFNLADAPVSINTQKQGPVDYPKDTEYDRQVPLSLKEHLLNLYFTWQDPSSHVVDREMFEKGKIAWDGMEVTPFYSETLCCAM